MGPLLVLLAAMTAGAAAQECYMGVCVLAQDNSKELHCALNATCTTDNDCAGLECAGEYSDLTLDSIAWATVLRDLLPVFDGLLEELRSGGSYEEFVDSMLYELAKLFSLYDEEGGEVPMEIGQSPPPPDSN